MTIAPDNAGDFAIGSRVSGDALKVYRSEMIERDRLEAHVRVEKLLGKSETLVNVSDLERILEALRETEELFKAYLGDYTLEVPDVARPQHRIQLAIDRRRNIESAGDRGSGVGTGRR